MITHGKKKLFLIDSYALIYRAYFAFIKNPRMNSKGFDTSAIYGFLNTLTELIREEKPTHIATVFDLKGPTKRHELYSDYKANRDAMPEGISLAIPYIKELIDSLNIQQISLPGYEADDLIGTLSKKAEKEGFTTYMITPDKDFAQLVTDNIFIYKPGKRGDGPTIMGEKDICEKYGLQSINQFIDFLAMIGDSSDNIPGIAGVGPKTAQKLIEEYGSLVSVYKNVDEISGKLKDKLIDSKENAFLSKKLVKIIIDAPLKVSISDLIRKKPNSEKFEKLCQELEFKNIINRVKKSLDIEAQLTEEEKKDHQENQLDLFNQPVLDKKINSIYKSAKFIKKSDDIERYSKQLLLQKKVSINIIFDTNTTKNIQYVLLASTDHHVTILEPDKSNIQIIETLIHSIFYSKEIIKIGYDFKNIINQLSFFNSPLPSKSFFDIMLAGYLLNPDGNNTLDRITNKYIHEFASDISNDVNPLLHKKKYIKILSNQLIRNIELYLILNRKLEEDKLIDLFWDIEMKLLFILSNMELVGFSIDKKMLEEYSIKLKKISNDLKIKIFNISGKEFNISSPKQLGEILFDHLKIDPKAKKTKTGQFSTSEPILQKLKNKHPIIKFILEYRSIEKLLSTYVNALPNLVNPKTKKVHSTFNQAITGTGRLSSKEPNLQNIPIRTNYGKEVRKAFIPSENNVLISADYSQIELRLIAELSQEPTMIQSFAIGEDIHKITASKIFKVPLERVTPEMRSNAKTVNFGIIYGVSAFGLSQQTNLSRKESANVIDSYFKEYSKLKEYMSNNINFARDNGYVETILGRRRYLADINSRNALLRTHAERNAVNAPIQGSAADIIKLAMIKINETIIKQNLHSKLVLQVHDELIFDVLNSEKDEMKLLVRDCMENAFKTKVPLKVEMGIGNNWLIAH